jgi:hypothetical protein
MLAEHQTPLPVRAAEVDTHAVRIANARRVPARALVHLAPLFPRSPPAAEDNAHAALTADAHQGHAPAPRLKSRPK